MRPKGVHILSLEKGEKDDSGRVRKWNYKLEPYDHFRTPGAFRAVSVEALRRTRPEIKLYEWQKLKSPSSTVKDKNSFPAYAAVSHVWKKSDEVRRLAKGAKSDLKILVEGDTKMMMNTNTISWSGLRQIANAAHQLHCDYFWLDLLCIDQIPRPDPDPSRTYRDNDGEKALQITNMANIYKRAETVIVMVGGVSAVQGVDKPSAWMDRAWTLQEAAICYGKTWAYVHWPYQRQFDIDCGTDRPISIKFIPVAGEPDNCLIELVRLLEMPDLSKATTTPPLGLPSGFQVKCLDGRVPGQARHTARVALLAVIDLKGTEECKRAGIWRSMLLRTSSHPVDIVYSVAGLFDVEIDPYRKDRNVQYLLHDLATKTGAKGSPGWFGIGGVEGSLIVRNQKSRLIPRVPVYRKQELPFYKFGQKRRLTHELVDDSKNYISRFDIKFITSSQPHIICARMLHVTSHSISYPFPGRKPDQHRIDLVFGRLRGTCTYRGVQSDTVVVVGTIGSWSNPPSPCKGHQYILFMSWNGKQWTVKGDGYLRLRGGPGNLPVTRYHFTVGQGSPKIRRWPCDHNVAATKRVLDYSYGIMPRPYLGPDPYQKGRPIEWFGFKGKAAKDEPWHHFHIYFKNPTNKQEMDDQKRKLPSSWPLCLVASNSRDRPEFLDEATPGSLFRHANIPMEYGDADLGNPRSDILYKTFKEGMRFSPVGLYAKVEFRKHVVYLKTKPEKDRDPDFERIAVASYR